MSKGAMPNRISRPTPSLEARSRASEWFCLRVHGDDEGGTGAVDDGGGGEEDGDELEDDGDEDDDGDDDDDDDGASDFDDTGGSNDEDVGSTDKDGDDCVEDEVHSGGDDTGDGDGDADTDDEEANDDDDEDDDGTCWKIKNRLFGLNRLSHVKASSTVVSVPSSFNATNTSRVMELMSLNKGLKSGRVVTACWMFANFAFVVFKST
jgi:hypothetical protein